MKGILAVLLLMLQVGSAMATSLTLSQVPDEVEAEAVFDVWVEFSTTAKNATYYLAGVFFKTKGSKLFGFTEVSNDNLVPLTASPSSFYPITTSPEGSWSGKMRVKADISQAGFDGEGMYYMRIDRYTGKSDNAAESSNAVELKLLYTPPATPTPTPEATAKPTSPPTPKATAEASPTVTAKPVTTAPPPSPVVGANKEVISVPIVLGIVDASVTEPEPAIAATTSAAVVPQSKTAAAILIIGGILLVSGVIPLSLKLFPR